MNFMRQSSMQRDVCTAVPKCMKELILSKQMNKQMQSLQAALMQAQSDLESKPEVDNGDAEVQTDAIPEPEPIAVDVEALVAPV